jgi:polyisoprenoid-binding protein YceI
MALPIAAGDYGIDTTHSQIGFSIRHLGISFIRGQFDRYSGALYVGDDLAGTVVTIDAEMGSINSGNRWRDEHMYGADWLDVDNHPEMSFRSTSIVDTPSGYAMTGDLTIKAITQPVTFDVVYNGCNVFPMDHSMHFGFEASGSIRRSAFDVSFGIPLLSDEVALRLDVQFVLPQAEH